jgi:hypothetical protein
MPTCAIPKGLSPQPLPYGVSIRAIRRIVAWTKSCAGFSPMSLAQKDQLLEIGSRARLGKPIICKGLSVPCDKSWNLSAHEVRTNLLFTMSNRTGGEPRSSPQTHMRMTRNGNYLYPTPTQQSRGSREDTMILSDRVLVEPDGIEPTTSCLQSRRSPS